MIAFVKWDANKPPLFELSVYDASVFDNEARCLKIGADRYGRSNWRNAEPEEGFERYCAAALRHLLALSRGQLLDPDSGLPHTAHIRCCMGFLEHYQGLKR